MLSIVGLALAFSLWIGAMEGIVWSRHRSVPIIMAAGFDVKKRDQRISIARVARRHTLGWTAFFVMFFLILALTSFPLWQRLGFAAILSIIYGLSGVSRGEKHTIGNDEPHRVAMFGPVRDRIWYRILAIAEWVGYLGSLVFATQLVFQVLG